MNATIEKFGYPETLICEYRHWLVLLRPAQVTAGSLVLAAKGDATALGGLPSAAFEELGDVTADIEQALASAFNFDKINYLMLMMVDPHVHFHVFPRYASERSMAGMCIADRGWPGLPDLSSGHVLDDASREAAVRAVADHWPSRSNRNEG